MNSRLILGGHVAPRFNVIPPMPMRPGLTWLTKTMAKLVGSVLTLSQVTCNASPADCTVDVLGELTLIAWTEARRARVAVMSVVGNMAAR